jgi:hypothetical protein
MYVVEIEMACSPPLTPGCVQGQKSRQERNDSVYRQVENECCYFFTIVVCTEMSSYKVCEKNRTTAPSRRLTPTLLSLSLFHFFLSQHNEPES